MSIKLKTQWCHKISYLDGYIRSGVNKSPEKSRPNDVIRLKIKTDDGTGDCDLQLEMCEATDVIKVLKTAKKKFKDSGGGTLRKPSAHLTTQQGMPETQDTKD